MENVSIQLYKMNRKEYKILIMSFRREWSDRCGQISNPKAILDIELILSYILQFTSYSLLSTLPSLLILL